MEKYDVIIIGAGISGLSLAHYCADAGFKTLVIEKSERVGGALHSHKFEDADGFWLEMGAHTCYNSYRNLIGIIEDCRILDRVIKRESVQFKMVIDDHIKSIPSQLDFMELLLSGWRLFSLSKEGESVGSYYRKIVGNRNFEKVFGPAFDAVISQKADDFPADMLFKKRERRKDIIKKFTFNGGLQTIADAIKAESGVKVLSAAEVNTIEYGGRFYRASAGGEDFESSHLALAVPASAAAKLLKGAFPEVSERLYRIKTALVESVGVAVKKEMVPLKPVAGIIAKDDAFFSAVSRDAVADGSYRGFTFHFKPGMLDHGARIKRICEVLNVKECRLDKVVTKENIVPSLRTGHDKLINEVDRLIEGKGLFLTGNYFDGLAIEDCVTRSLGEFLRLKKYAD